MHSKKRNRQTKPQSEPFLFESKAKSIDKKTAVSQAVGTSMIVKTLAPLNRPTTAAMINKTQNSVLSGAPVYRIAQPFSSKVDINSRLWHESAKRTIGLTSMNDLFQKPSVQNKDSARQQVSPNQIQNEFNIKKPFTFLSSIGGTTLVMPSEQVPTQSPQRQQSKKPRPQTVSTINRIDFQSLILEEQRKIAEQQQQESQILPLSSGFIQTQTASQPFSKPPRLNTKSAMTQQEFGLQKRPMSTVYQGNAQQRKTHRIQSALIDIKNNTEDQQFNMEPPSTYEQRPNFRPKSNWIQSRPISGRTAAPSQFFQLYTKYTNFSSLELPYEDLFDRNERTIAATFARFGDLGYYSPIQRIGCNMQFSAKLKQVHLQEIIDLLESVTNAQNDKAQVPIQLQIVEDLNPFQKRNKTGINSGNDDIENKRLPISLSLYPEYFEDPNDETLTPGDIAKKVFQEILDEMNGNYDPTYFGLKNYIYIDPSQWPESIRKNVDTSISRYWHYIQSDLIKSHEVPKYKKEWMVNAFNLIDEKLLKNEVGSRVVFQEIFEYFKISMKRCMLDYILRSPEERKRLHITLLPREYPCSAQRIAREGGFNILLFPEWHIFCEMGRAYCQTNLTSVSPVTAALTDWFEDFRHFKLCELSVIRQVSKLGYTFSLNEFSRIQSIYRLNTLCLFQHIWHRGAILIIKKQQYLRIPGSKKWTFIGPTVAHKIQHDGIDEQEEFDYQHDDQGIIYRGEDLSSYINIKMALQFIKKPEHNPESWLALSAVTERMIWLSNPNPYSATELSEMNLETVNGVSYKLMEKSDRKRLQDNAAVLMTLQLRRLVQTSLRFLEQEFLCVPDYHSWCLEKKIVNHSIRQNKQMDIKESLMQFSINLKDNDINFNRPSFLFNSHFFQPFLKLDMIIEQDHLKFLDSDEQVKQDMMEIIRNIIVSCERYLHPATAKVIIDKPTIKISKPFRSLQFNYDPDMGGLTKEDYDKFFKQYWEHIKIEEKISKTPGLMLSRQDNTDINIQQKRYLTIASISEQEFVSLENRIVSHVLKHYEECYMVFELFDQFRGFIDYSYDKEIKQVIGKKQITNEEFKIYTDVLRKFDTLLYQVPLKVNYPLFQVNNEPVIKTLRTMIVEYREKLFSRFEQQLLDTARSISDKYVQISSFIRKSLRNPDDVDEMEKYIADLANQRILLKQKTTDVFLRVMFLLKQQFTLSESLLHLSEELYFRPNQLDRELIEQEEKHAVERARLEATLKQRRTNFETKVDVYCHDAHSFETFTEYGKYKTYVKEITLFEDTLGAAQREMDDILDQERKLFGLESPSDRFIALQKKVSPFSEMWKNIQIFLDSKKRWINGPIVELDSNEFENTIRTQQKAVSKLTRAFAPSSIAHRVASEFQRDVEQVAQYQKTVEVLSNPGLRERHWNYIQEIMNIQFNYKEGTLRDLLKKGVEEKINKIEEISENASKEFSLENQLLKMEKEWELLSLVVLNYKNRGVLVLQGSTVEEIQILLDEHCIKAQTIRTNPAVKFMEEKANRWERLVMYTQEVLEVWVKVQTMFLYLEPIFQYEDISRTLFDESEKFQKVQMNWSYTMQKVQQNPLLRQLELTVPGLLENLQQSQHLIEDIQRGLEHHLELKRLDFPRFFFLSNDDLINILAEARDPIQVQPHVKKCFEGIQELIFSSAVEIMGMRSSEKEQVMFDMRVCPRDYKSNVEQWLLKLEQEMQNTLKKLCTDAYIDLQRFTGHFDRQSIKVARQDWLQKWTSQCILTASCTHFTQVVEESLRTKDSLHTLEQPLKNQLQEIVQLVRTTQNNIERMMLSALIVLEVHNIDILKELIQNNTTNITNFQWISQLRYYLMEETTKIMVKLIYTNIDYGYEYLGVGTRLVITPLTDRCYRTMAGALALNLGGAPEGPAGTGKTESTKDLAKAVAIQCIVFNCGEGLNSHAMAKFFKGLTSAGAWSCFDEFNRIDLEVLSVIAQQIMQIQQAKGAQKSKFIFEGTEIKILQSCNIFITMNPGYAGRSELPDNLKALFRPCAMMVPDYALIAEISLYSFGFVEARALAKKIVAVYKLCSEQLSSQDHYDYGMRAVKAVLTAAAQLKRKSPNEKEEILILRAINDINLPKFLYADTILFNGIVSDLFPGTKLPSNEQKNLQESMTFIINKLKLQQVTAFKRKVIQLYDMVNCRHGLMLVGQTLSGKSTCYKVLAQTLSQCNKTYNEELQTHYHIINPKAITLNQLYGHSDPVSKEWTEGILAEIYRKCATLTVPDRQFIVFDGPVDADWIENMNTVLDDNKKLCLMNGETISMSDSMTIMFEVQDLAQASPATVSRCGMVYLEADQLGWQNILQTNLQMEEPFRERVEDLFLALFEKCSNFVKSKVHEHEKLPESAHVIQIIRLITGLIEQAKRINRKQEEFLITIDALFAYSLLWTVGGGIEESGRKSFEQYIKKLLREPLKCESKKDKMIKLDKASTFPELSGTQAYDFYFDPEEFRWKNWKDSLGDRTIDRNAQFNEIMVDTSESLRVTFLLKQSIDYTFPFLLIGPSGVGKTRYIRNCLNQQNQKTMIFVNFSATTSSTSTQSLIDSKLERRRKGVYGPPLGHQGILFIDDLNMPRADKYGAQPPIELLRQFQDQGGWYSHERQFMQIINITLIAAMSPGRVPTTQRLLRHFNIFALAPPDTVNMQRIYGNIIHWHLSRMKISDNDLQQSFDQAIEATIDLYNQAREGLKATPTKSWYFLNMRDISRVVQGMILVQNPSELNADSRKVGRLWLHEVARTFFDRLHESDYSNFWTMVQNSIRTKLRDDIRSLMKPYEDLSGVSSHTSAQSLQKYFFSDILDDNVNSQDRYYCEVISQRRIQSKVQYYLDEHNQQSKKPLNLALFEYALEHLLKILRILRMQQGHALLIGLGGSGRQSLVRLANHIMELNFFQFEVTKAYSKDQWNDDIRKVMIHAGADAKESCFLLSDQQMTKQFLLEDVNALLNTGDVPALFSPEDFVPLIDRLRTRAKKEGLQTLWESGTQLQFYDYFVEGVKRKLHVVLTMSPVGDTIRNRIRLFPSLVNCTTIDCFHAWPEEALEAVARKFLSELQFDNNQQRQLIQQCKFMHETLQINSKLFQEQEGRINYVTPGSFFSLLQTFSSLLSVERQKLEESQSLYTAGVQKLDFTQEQVLQMQLELTEKTPILKATNEETAKLFEEIQAQAKAMEPKKLKAEMEENIVNERVMEAEIIKKDCEKDLSVAKPKLKQAEDALNTLDANDINSIKAMLKPPETVQLVMEAVCVMCGVPAILIPNPQNPKERIMSYWEASKKFLSDKDFLPRLINFDKDNIKEDIMKRIRDKYISQTQIFNAKRVEKASSAAKGLCEWILALDEYEKVLKIVRPKQQRYNESKQEVARLQVSLKQTRDELETLNSEISKLQIKLQDLQLKQQALIDEIKLCEKKLVRASQLMSELGGERERWEASAQKYKQRLQLVVGDMMIAAGVVSNLGIFSANFRYKLYNVWLERLKNANGSIMASDPYSIEIALTSPMIIRKWRMNGLPSDPFSTENGIILSKCQRYPLLIDPQNQGNKFVKYSQIADGRQLKVTKQTDSDFIRVVENAVSFGQSLLIENILEDIDSVLDSILAKHTFKNIGVLSVKLGENIIEFNKLFKLFFTSKLRNPHYSPETAMKVTLVNFTITQGGLEDQLLELCIQKEKPDLEDQKNKLIITSHKNQLELQHLEMKILEVLKKASNILDDEEGIAILQQSKAVSLDIEERQKVTEFTEKKINEARTGYREIAIQSALLFFAVIALSPLDTMYQYSLNWFISLYQDAFDKSDATPYIKSRIQNVCNTVTQFTYQQVCRGLFEKDKLLFSLIITLKQIEMKKQLDNAEFTFLIQPIQFEESPVQNPLKDWIPQITWLRIQELMKLSNKFSYLIQSLTSFEAIWKSIMVEVNPQQLKFPEPFNNATPLQRLCILKVLRPDKLVKAIQEFVAAEIGEKFIQPPQFSLPLAYAGSNSSSPLLFILPGTDPMNALMNFAESKNVQLKSVSLGQGQGVVAETYIEEAKQNGNWVILQNCHLAPSWMPKLEKICENIQNIKVNSGFRLWLSSYPSNELPAYVIQSAIKITNEPPSGVKANILGSFNSTKQHQNTLNLIYSLCFFHAVLQERRQFGPLGFNIPYDFNQSDLLISIRQLVQLTEKEDSQGIIAFDALTYLVGECNYGGRVTDAQDRRTLRALLYENICPKTLDSNFKFGSLPEFPIPSARSYEEFIQFIQGMPTNYPSQIFGFHPNAEIVKDINATDELLRNILLVSQGQIATGQNKEEDMKSSSRQFEPPKTPEAQLLVLCGDILSKLPKRFDTEIAIAKYPHDYKNSMNTVLLQEILRYNKLLNIITNSLKELDSSLKGLVAMTDSLEKISKNMLLGQVPEMWKKFSYPSIKPLGSYMTDFYRRLKYFHMWIDSGLPTRHWISGFFFTQSFLTATLQNYARKYQIAIDKLAFEFEYFEQAPDNDNQNNEQLFSDGQQIYGLYLEGCKWDYNRKLLTEPDPKVLAVLAPIIMLKPSQFTNDQKDNEQLTSTRFKCPVYKTAERRGILSTTGHSTNFIMTIDLPSMVEESFWIKRGVALLCQLSD